MYVQFSDSTQATIISFFGCPQDPTIWSNQGEVGATDARWKAYYNSLPASAQELLPPPA